MGAYAGLYFAVGYFAYDGAVLLLKRILLLVLWVLTVVGLQLSRASGLHSPCQYLLFGAV